MEKSALLMMFWWTGIYVMCLCAYSVEARGGRKKNRLPDLILRDFINVPDENFPASSSSQEKMDDPVSVGQVTMAGITEILHEKYGLSDMSSRSSAFLLDVYQKLQEGESLTRASGHRSVDVAILQADTIRSFKPKGDSENVEDTDKIELTFSLSGITQEEVTKRAELRLKSLRHHRRAAFRIKVTVLVDGDVIKRLSYKVKADKVSRDRSALIDLTSVVQEILEAGHSDATLHFVIRPTKKSRQPSPTDDDVSERSRRSTETTSDALLVVYTKDNKFFSKFSASLRVAAAELERSEQTSRVKRGSRDRKHKVSGECGKVDFTVDFATIGWDKWIVYPSSFTAYRCGGHCKAPSIQSHNPTNHAVLQSLMRKRDRDSAPLPCCVPTKFRPISMLYYEHDEVVVRKHENMVVDTCSCR